MFMRLILSAFVFLAVLPAALSQCCSMGNPGTGQESAGVLPKNHLRVYTFYKQGHNETYFRKNVRLVNYGVFSRSSYDFAGIFMAYGLTHKLTLEHEAGYFFSKELRYHDPELDALSRSGYGLSNGVLSLHYAVWRSPVRAMELTAAAGVKYPFSGKPLVIEGVEIPVELQPSTGAWGFVGRIHLNFPLGSGLPVLLLQHRFETNLPNYNNYTYGNAHHTALSVVLSLPMGVETLWQLRNERRAADATPTAARLASQGSNVLFFSPTLSRPLPGGLHLSVFADLPLAKYYFGEQLSSKFAAGVSLSGQFPLKTIPKLPAN
jgi:hypothetical protein